MKFDQFLCFAPHLSEEEASAVHVLPELPSCNRRRRRRLARIIFSRHSRPQYIGCSASSPFSGRDGLVCNHRTVVASETRSALNTARKSVSNDDRDSVKTISSSSFRSSQKAPSSPSSSSMPSPVFPSTESSKAPEVVEKWCALWLMVVSLMVMVFCGRICAILWTASGLWFLPRRRSVHNKSVVRCSEILAAPAPEVRRKALLRQDKRRVVLEGFLGRNKQG